MASSAVIRIQGLRYALPMLSVLRVVSAVEVTAFPAGPETFLGVVDIAGEIIPVVDLRFVLGTQRRDIDLDDVMVAIETSNAKLVLPVDAVEGVVDLASASHSGSGDVHARCIGSFLHDDNGIIFGIDVDRIVSTEEIAAFGSSPSNAAS